MTGTTSDIELQRWLKTRAGRGLARLEKAEVRAQLRPLSGHLVAHVGQVFNAVDDLIACGDFRHRVRIAATPRSDVQLAGVAEQLPFQADSVSTLVLPHALELAENPHDVIREAHRVLVPEGHLILSGFNPWSVAGLAKIVIPARQQPWSDRWVAAGRVRDWLALLGFETVMVRPGWLQRTGNLLNRVPTGLLALTRHPPLSFAAGVYVLAARKKVIWMRPVVSRWQIRPALPSVGLAGTTARASRSRHLRLIDGGLVDGG